MSWRPTHAPPADSLIRPEENTRDLARVRIHGEPPGCWADDGGQVCLNPGTSTLGLCERHAAAIVPGRSGAPQPREDPPTTVHPPG